MSSASALLLSRMAERFRQDPKWPGSPCEDLSMGLVWVTGSSGTGKSTVCALLRSRGELAVDADLEGLSHWVDRTSGRMTTNPPYPTPGGWLDRFAWRISRTEVETLSTRMHDNTFADRPKMRLPCGICSTTWSVWWLTTRRYGTVSEPVLQMHSASIRKSWRRRSDGTKTLSPHTDASARRLSTVRDLRWRLRMQSSQPLQRSTQNNLVDDHRACPHTLPGWGAALRHFRATTADSLVEVVN